MKEKLTLFFALSLIICLTIYKNNINDNILLENHSTIIPEEVNNNVSSYYKLQTNINDQLNNDICEKTELTINKLSFNNAFKYYSDCNYDTFIWNEMEYTTLLKKDVKNKIDKNEPTKTDLVTN